MGGVRRLHLLAYYIGKGILEMARVDLLLVAQDQCKSTKIKSRLKIHPANAVPTPASDYCVVTLPMAHKGATLLAPAAN